MTDDRVTRWELGSSFHLDLGALPFAECWLPKGAVLAGSGRDALRLILAVLADRRVRRLYVPEYYCHEVTAIVPSNVQTVLYDEGPWNESVRHELEPDEAMVVVEYFGLKATTVVHGGVVILDRTHDLLSEHSYLREPDFVFASLRKCLPVPDGGIAWSAKGGETLSALPTTSAHEAMASNFLSAMAMKATYLANGVPQKETFLPRLQNGDGDVCAPHEPSGASSFTRGIAGHIDVAAILRKRRENIDEFAKMVSPALQGVRIVPTPAYPILRTDSPEACVELKEFLIANRVYPAVLWPPTGGTSGRWVRLSETLLVVHADFRYSFDDMRVVCVLIETFDGL